MYGCSSGDAEWVQLGGCRMESSAVFTVEIRSSLTMGKLQIGAVVAFQQWEVEMPRRITTSKQSINIIIVQFLGQIIALFN